MLPRPFGFLRTQDSNSYDLLPTSEWTISHSRTASGFSTVLRRVLPRRSTVRLLLRVLVVVLAIACLVVYVVLNPWIWGSEIVARLFGPSRLPPLYPEFREAELALPQHHVTDPFANGQKYLWVASHPTRKSHHFTAPYIVTISF